MKFTAMVAATIYSTSATISEAACSGVKITLDGANIGSVVAGMGGFYVWLKFNESDGSIFDA
jgi:hypothetical protein